MVVKTNINALNQTEQTTAFNTSKALLERLWHDDLITDLQFIAGMSYGIMRARAFRSFAIPTRLSAMGHLLEKISGKHYDSYEDFRIEKAWSYMTKSLDPVYHNSFKGMPLLDKLVLDSNNHSVSITPALLHSYRHALDITADIWISLEKSRLQTLIPKHVGAIFSKRSTYLH